MQYRKPTKILPLGEWQGLEPSTKCWKNRDVDFSKILTKLTGWLAQDQNGYWKKILKRLVLTILPSCNMHKKSPGNLVKNAYSNWKCLRRSVRDHISNIFPVNKYKCYWLPVTFWGARDHGKLTIVLIPLVAMVLERLLLQRKSAWQKLIVPICILSMLSDWGTCFFYRTNDKNRFWWRKVMTYG